MNDFTPRAGRTSIRMSALVGLGFASGLPSAYRLLGSSAQAWLNEAGYDVAVQGLLMLVTLPFALNFLWAPFLDWRRPPMTHRLGRRRGWLLWVQGALIVAMTALAFAGPDGESSAEQATLAALLPFLAAGLLVSFLAATQDVLADAYRTDVLPDAELGLGAACFVNGYRVAMLVTGGGVLLIAGHIGFQAAYLAAAGVMSLGVAATLLAPMEPQVAPPATFKRALFDPLIEFVKRKRWGTLSILAFIVVYKLPDAMANAMTMPVMQDRGYSLVQIALVREWFGLAVVVIGAFAGGAVVAWLGVMRSLWLLLVLQAASNLGFVFLAWLPMSIVTLATVVTVENFCAGMVTAGFIAFLMSHCNRRYSATQYAMFTSLMFLFGALSGAISGYLVRDIGFVWFFLYSAAMALPAMLLLLTLRDPLKDRGEQAADVTAG